MRAFPVSFLFFASVILGTGAEPIKLGTRRELFVDNHLIASKSNVVFHLHEPRDEGAVLKFDAPWEGPFSAYVSVLQESHHLRAYYRGKAMSTRDGQDEVTCVAESVDGRHWTKPKLGLFEAEGTRENNIVLAEKEFSHNFSPFIDGNSKAKNDQRYKAIAGTHASGLKPYVSADGLRWKPLTNAVVLTVKDLPGFSYAFDSQNVPFWSEAEQRYVLFFRVYKDRKRRIARMDSNDFLKWENFRLMEYRGADGQPAPIEQLYTSQTHSYFRAPHLYVALAARFMVGRQVLSAEEAEAIGVHPKYFKDISDAVFMTSRGGNIYDRVDMGGFLKPGIGAENWVSRTTYPALNTVQTGPTEMSIYANQNYAQPTAHLHRYSLRLDGFMSLRAPYEGGEVITHPITFSGNRLLLNFSTSAAGGIRLALVTEDGKPIPGFTLEENIEVIGNEIARPVKWKNGSDLSSLAGKTVCLHFRMKDADLFALQFDRK